MPQMPASFFWEGLWDSYRKVTKAIEEIEFFSTIGRHLFRHFLALRRSK